MVEDGAPESSPNRRRFSVGDWISAATLGTVIVGAIYTVGVQSAKLDAVLERVGKIENGVASTVAELRGDMTRLANRIDVLYDRSRQPER